MKQRIFVLWSFLLLGVNSCGVSSLDDPIVIADLENEFVIDLWETLSPGQRNLTFRIRSVATESCSNYSIDSPHYINGNKINISIKDIVAPTACEPGIAPAGTVVDLGQVAPGIYGLRVDLKSTVVNEGQLLVNDNSYSAQLFTENGIQFDHARLLRVPDQALWGYIDYSASNDSAVAQEFIAEIKTIATDFPLTEGYYGHFAIEGGALSVNGQPEGESVLPLLLEKNADDREFEALVEEFRDLHEAELEIVLLDADGHRY